jgi:polyisoprenoid-binding protein YceI
MKAVVVLCVLGISSFAAAENIQVNKGHVEFLAIGKPSAIKIRGKGDALQSQLAVKEKKLSGHLVFDLSSLDTGIDMRNNHMKEKYLETGKYKNAEMDLVPVDLAQDVCKDDMKLEKVPFEGKLKLHGVEKPVKGDFDLKSQKGQGQANVRFKLNISDYQIEIPVYMGIKVADQVENTVELNWSCSVK